MPYNAEAPCVVFACDEGYAMPLATAIRSLRESYRGAPPLRVIVLSERMRQATQRKIDQSAAGSNTVIEWATIDLALFAKFSTLAYTSKMTFARLLIPEIFPPTVSKVIYLDADLLVLDDITAMWSTNLEGRAFGAVTDRMDPALKANVAGLEAVPRVERYFNAGVLLIDVPLWRQERISERAMEYLEKHPSTPYADQDALNAVCDGRWTKLDERWNTQDCNERDIAALPAGERPAIAHFVMAAKPWKASARNVNSQFYDGFRRRTAFARSRPEVIRDMARREAAKWKRRMRQSAWLRSGWFVEWRRRSAA